MRVDRKVDSLFDWADRMYKGERFAEVDKVLARLSVEKLHDALIFAWVCIAWWPEQGPDKGKIPSRVLLHRRIRKHWEAARPDMIKSLRGSMPGFFTWD